MNSTSSLTQDREQSVHEPQLLGLEHLRPDMAYVIWDKQRGKITHAGLLISQNEMGPWNVLTKAGYETLDLFDFASAPNYLILNGRYYDDNPDQVHALPRVPRFSID